MFFISYYYPFFLSSSEGNEEEICNPQRHPLAKAFSVFIVLFVKALSHVRLFVTSWTIVRRPPGSSDHGILQARTLEWVAISFSRRSP